MDCGLLRNVFCGLKEMVPDSVGSFLAGVLPQSQCARADILIIRLNKLRIEGRSVRVA